MRQFKSQMFVALGLASLLSACTSATYVPRTKDISEERISGDYWYQKFTMYNPADSSRDCLIDRTGNRLDLNSPAQLAEIWRKFCQNPSDYDNQGS